jgi:hypothetical protein
MMSLIHNDETRPVTTKQGQQIHKLLFVVEYTKFMGGTDKKELLQTYLVERKTINEWFVKLFCGALNKTVLKAVSIYRQNVDRKVVYLKCISTGLTNKVLS